jgi:hypothetical protein
MLQNSFSWEIKLAIGRFAGEDSLGWFLIESAWWEAAFLLSDKRKFKLTFSDFCQHP